MCSRSYLLSTSNCTIICLLSRRRVVWTGHLVTNTTGTSPYFMVVKVISRLRTKCAPRGATLPPLKDDLPPSTFDAVSRAHRSGDAHAQAALSSSRQSRASWAPIYHWHQQRRRVRVGGMTSSSDEVPISPCSYSEYRPNSRYTATTEVVS